MTLASLLRSAVRHLLPAANGTAPPTPSPAVPIAPRPRRIGDILLERRLVTAYQLEGALETQRRSGSRLGQVMLHDGAIDDLGLASAIATQLNLPLLARAEIATDERARDLLPESVARRHRFVPLGVREDSLMVAAEDALSSEATSEVGLHTTLRTTVVIAPRSVLDELRHRVYGERHLEVATAELLNRSPEESAYRVLSGRQKIAFCLVLAVSAVAVAIDAVAAAIAFNLLCLAFYSSFSIYKLSLIYRATAHDLELPTSTAEIAALDERDLPALHDPGAAVPRDGRAPASRRLDRRARLPTREARREAPARGGRRRDDRGAALDAPTRRSSASCIVPDGAPKTKPKACNYGLLGARASTSSSTTPRTAPSPTS